MRKQVTRREFLSTLGAGMAATSGSIGRSNAAPAENVKPISGSWFEFQHASTVEGVNWNPACACFTCEQWQSKVFEMANIGMKDLVLMSTALYNRAFYRTAIYPPWRLHCADPIEAVLSAADRLGVRFFMGGGFYGDWASPGIISDPAAARRRLHAIEELAGLYGHHRSFYGWYWPNEAFIDRYYSDAFIRYVNSCSELARRLMPRARILIAPYGTRVAVPDDKYVRQLQSIDVDVIAYQDEVGVQKSKVTETPAFYEGLRKAHDRVPRIAIWADVEIFRFEGKVYHSALLPAPFERVQKQLEAVSPWVDRILAYQYQGMMNKPGSDAFAGPPDSVTLYRNYADWLRRRQRSA